MVPRVQILQQRPQGFIAFDTCTTLFEVAFQTTSLRLDEEQLRSFAASVDDQVKAHRGVVCPQAKLFYFHQGAEAFRLVLCMTEMELLAEMLDEAMIAHSINEVMGEK